MKLELTSYYCTRVERLLGLYREIHKKYPAYGKIDVEDGVVEWENVKVIITVRI